MGEDTTLRIHKAKPCNPDGSLGKQGCIHLSNEIFYPIADINSQGLVTPKSISISLSSLSSHLSLPFPPIHVPTIRP